MHRRGAVGSENLQFQAERGSSHHQVNEDDGQDGEQESTVDRRAEEARQAGHRPARLRVCGTVVSGSLSASFISTLARLVPRKLIISVVMISLTP
jgi:hypothetical protein